MKGYCTAILLAAGSGRRMNSPVAKQFLPLMGKPLLWYSLHIIEESPMIDDCIVVTAAEDISYVKKEILQQYDFRKVSDVIAGGRERWESVSHGIDYVARNRQRSALVDNYLMIHDGARPFLDEKIIVRTREAAASCGACVAAVPSKDTVRLSNGSEFATGTPDRNKVWIVQTPQVFEFTLIKEAYDHLKDRAEREGSASITVTDDASVVELFSDIPVKLVEGSYKNIKITTPEDMKIAEALV